MLNVLEKDDLIAGIPKKSAIDRKDAISKEFRLGYVAAMQEHTRQKIAEEMGMLQEGKAAVEEGLQQLLALNAQIESGMAANNAGVAFPPPQGAGFPPPEAGGPPPSPGGMMPPGGMPMGPPFGKPPDMNSMPMM